MKTTGVICVAVIIVTLGFYDTVKFQRNIKTLEDILSLINLFKTNISYKKSDYCELYDFAVNEGYKNILFANNEIILPNETQEQIRNDFVSFVSKVGTTDNDGQLLICEEYKSKFSSVLSEYKRKSESKIQINLSLSLLSAFSIFILFL